MTISKNSPVKVKAAERRAAALSLRVQGKTLAQIGESLGVSTQRAYQYVKEGLARLDQMTTVDAEALRRLSVEQLEAMLAAHLPKAIAGDVRSGNLAIRAIAERARITGLVKAAQPEVKPESPYAKMTPEELRAEARRLGIYPLRAGSPGDPYAPAPSTNGHTPQPVPQGPISTGRSPFDPRPQERF